MEQKDKMMNEKFDFIGYLIFNLLAFYLICIAAGLALRSDYNYQARVHAAQRRVK
jgi:hypothetical protein